MVSLSMERHIAADPDRVFDVFTDIDRAADRISGITRIEKLTDGPVGRGTRFRETRVMFKREATEELEFTVFEAGERCRLECQSCGSHFATEYRFRPEGDGTRVEIEVDCRPRTFFAKLMSPLGKLMMKSMTKCFDQDLEDLEKAAVSRN